MKINCINKKRILVIATIIMSLILIIGMTMSSSNVNAYNHINQYWLGADYDTGLTIDNTLCSAHSEESEIVAYDGKININSFESSVGYGSGTTPTKKTTLILYKSFDGSNWNEALKLPFDPSKCTWRNHLLSDSDVPSYSGSSFTDFYTDINSKIDVGNNSKVYLKMQFDGEDSEYALYWNLSLKHKNSPAPISPQTADMTTPIASATLMIISLVAIIIVQSRKNIFDKYNRTNS